MIRFLPDHWLQALLRPIEMAVPSGSVYVETIAPDFRFVFVLALLLGWIAYRVRLKDASSRTFGLLAFCALSFVPWLATSGNGRYFMPTLFVVGPLCIALLHHLPLRQEVRLMVAGAMLAGQGFLLHDVHPWGSWGLAPWRQGPAFAVQVPEDLRTQPATYVTITSISYSLIAPQFDHRSRWVGIASQQSRPVDTPDHRRVRALLDASPVVYALFPSLVGAMQESRPPDNQSDAVDLSLMEVQLRLRRDHCRILPSEGLAAVGEKPGRIEREMRGFWVCRATRLPASEMQSKPTPSPTVENVFNRVEQACPRMFPPGKVGTLLLPVGARRFYPDSDMRLYVLNDGHVMYKYMRALNGVFLGRIEDVLGKDFRMDCNNIRGRSGFAWEREI